MAARRRGSRRAAVVPFIFQFPATSGRIVLSDILFPFNVLPSPYQSNLALARGNLDTYDAIFHDVVPDSGPDRISEGFSSDA
jgi:hypothetical protein